MPPPPCDLRIPADPAWLARAREAVDRAAAAAGFDAGSRHEIKVATSEAVANAIEHGTACADGNVRLRIVPEPEGLTVCVSDCGTLSRGPAPADPMPERGRGFGLMELLMDEVELSGAPERTVVCLHKRAGRASRAAAAP